MVAPKFGGAGKINYNLLKFEIQLRGGKKKLRNTSARIWPLKDNKNFSHSTYFINQSSWSAIDRDEEAQECKTRTTLTGTTFFNTKIPRKCNIH